MSRQVLYNAHYAFFLLNFALQPINCDNTLQKLLLIIFLLDICFSFFNFLLSNFYNILDPCNENQYRCESGDCIPLAKRCDGNKDCPYNTDELDCPKGTLLSRNIWFIPQIK